MAKPKGTTTRAFVCRGRLNGHHTHDVLHRHRVQAGVLYDANAAVNIGDRGTYYFLKRYGVTLDDVRQRRLCPRCRAPSDQGRQLG